MIFKKVKNPKYSATKKTRIVKLTDYICAPENANHDEKCVYFGARGFLTDELKSQQGEMIGLANENTKSKDPVEHYVMSWQAGEQPNEKQIEEAVDILLEEMGLRSHQVIYGLHDDTKNIHLHLAVNRIHPVTGKATRINDGWDIEAGHKAIAKITNSQGWNQEKNDLYEVFEDNIICRKVKKESLKISQEASKIEIKTGEISAERIAREQAWPIIQQARSWQDLHSSLAKKGIKFERKGSGAIIVIDGIAVKASKAHRAASLGKLQKKIGPYEKEGEGAKYYGHKIEESHTFQFREISQNNMRKLSECRLAYNGKRQSQSILSLNARAYRRGDESLRWSDRDGREKRGDERNRDRPIRSRELGNNVGFEKYIEMRKKYNEEKKQCNQEVKERHQKERNLLFQKQKKERENATAGNWRGRGKQLNEIRSLLAARHAKQRIEQKERQRFEREKLRNKYPYFSDFDEWRVKVQAKQTEEKNYIGGDEYVTPQPKTDLRSFEYEIQNGNVFYYHSNFGTAFVDRGRKIDVFDIHKKDYVLAALQLAATKWGALHIDGSNEYKNICLQLAAEHGFKILNSELQTEFEKKKKAVKAARADAMKTKQQKLFEIYHQAVGAERYRVTSIRIFRNGRKKAFILDKKDGVTNGFTQEEMTTRMREMIRMQRRGENIYYTPLSENKHHILIDDMTKEKLDQLLEDGYKPAVLIESSLENFQCVITIPKFGGEFDKEIGNRLTERLNKEYGDQNLSGCIHPHRAPGFQNRKEKHQKDDGSFPEVKLLKAGKRECKKCLERAKEIEKEYQELARQRAERQKKQTATVSYPGSPGAAYEAHLANIRQHITVEDRSRVDAMIAVRLRATGHSQESVAMAIKQCAPALRPDENRNWERYAQRTAEYAFGLKGDQQLQQNERYIKHWKKIEGQYMQTMRLT